MGESSDGSSSAARGAQESESSEAKGLWGRFTDVFFPTEDDEEDAPLDAPSRAALRETGAAMLGMGNLHRMRVEDVAIPKVEITAVPVDIDKDDLVAVFRDSGLSRLPVYEGTLDSPVGMVHLKDFALKHGFNGHGKEFDLRPMLRPLLYAPPSMPIGVLLQKMQTERMHMALVIDEYGGTDGLVTIEDLIEQVIGEIEDEHDIAEGDHVDRGETRPVSRPCPHPAGGFRGRDRRGAGRCRGSRRGRYPRRAGLHDDRAGADPGRGGAA